MWAIKLRRGSERGRCAERSGPGLHAIMTRRDRDPEPHRHHDTSEVGGHAGLESGQDILGNRGVNDEFPGSGELVSPSSLRAHTYT